MKKRSRAGYLLGIIAFCVAALALFINSRLKLERGIEITPTHTYAASYEPATYGIPEEIAGYSILLVQTSENNPCIPSGMMELTVMPIHPDPHNSLAPANESRNFSAEIHNLLISKQFEISTLFVEHNNSSREEFIDESEKRNSWLRQYGCARNSPAIVITNTPSPTLS
jgi:hypothetical protein